MRIRTKITAGQVRAIRRAMLAAPNKSVFQRLQCLWLRTKEDLSTEAIARTAGLSVSHVRRIWSEYLRGGLAAIQGRPKGGQRRRNLTVEQEQAVLAPLKKAAQAGQPVAVRDVKVRYENLLGRAVPPVTVYRLLARHQWRRVRHRPAFNEISGENRPPGRLGAPAAPRRRGSRRRPALKATRPSDRNLKPAVAG